MKVTILGSGTSQGIPVIACKCEVCLSKDAKDKRLRSSIHIEIDGKSFVVDSGPDFRQQLLVNQIDQLDAILYTHEHKDHVAGLDDVRAFNFTYKKSMPLYGEQRVLDSLKREYQYIFSNSNYPGVPQVELHSITNESFQIENTTIQPIRVMHGKLPILGFRIKDFVYITDASAIDEEELEKLKGVDTLILNAVRKQPHHSHYNLEQAVSLIQKINPKKAYITHISHLMGKHQEVNQELPSPIELAYDGLSFEI